MSLLINLLESLVVTWQARLQSKWKPACWLAFSRNYHSEEAKWVFDISKTKAMDDLWDAAENLPGFVPRSSLLVDGKHVMVIDVFTEVKWMDQITIEFSAPQQEQISKCSAKVVTESTGFLPLCIPFACFINLAFFWFPFLDGKGKCGHTMALLRREAEGKSGKPIQSQTIRYSKSNPRRSRQSEKHE